MAVGQIPRSTERISSLQNMSAAFAGFATRSPTGLRPWTQVGDFRPQTPNLPTPRQNPVGAYV